MNWTENELDEIAAAVEDYHENNTKVISGPKGLARAIRRYTDICERYCIAALRDDDALATKCAGLTRDEYDTLMRRLHGLE